jgi:hypothetical protein
MREDVSLGRPRLIRLEDAENDLRELKITTWRENNKNNRKR